MRRNIGQILLTIMALVALAQEDAKHKVCQKGSAYDQRLRRITKGMTHLFSTHPDLEERIERLEKMR